MAEDNANWIRFRFESEGFDPGTFDVLDFEGVERISAPYEFTINLSSTDLEVDLAALAREPARLVLAHGDHESKIHGVLAGCHETGRGENVAYYQVVLVPRLWLLSLQKQNQVHMSQKIDQTLQEELEQSGLVKGEDFEIRLTKTDYPEREYVVQYQESDLAFIRRQMEHYGIFFFFEQGEDKEKLVIADANSAFSTIPGDANIPYRPRRGQAESTGAVNTLRCTQSRMPNKVILADYNYRTPSVQLRVEQVVSEDGHGIVSTYGDHFKTPEEGQALAEVRAQEILAREKVFHGVSGVLRFHAGWVYALDEHPRTDVNGHSFLLTSVRHEGSQPVMGEGGGADAEPRYRNDFECIPAETAYRPPRETPKPKLYGVLNAKVDAASDGEYAEVDDQGRYKVRLPFDLTGRGDGQASRYMRKAEPYAGPGYGQHFPLHKDCEVLLTCVDGDPDRPVICGSVPNPEQASPVNNTNQATSVIRTGGGNFIELDDAAGAERIKMTCPHSETYFHLGAPNQGEPGLWAASAGLMNLVFGDKINTHTDSDRTDTTAGNSKTEVSGTHEETVDGNVTRTHKANVTERISGFFESFKESNKTEKVFADENKLTVGNTNSAFIGNKREANMAMELKETLGACVELKQALAISHTIGFKGTLHDATEMKKQPNLIHDVDNAWKATVGGAAAFDVSGPWIANASNIDISADGSITISGGSKVTVEVGGSKLEVSDGKITLKASQVVVDGELTGKKLGKFDQNALKA